MMLKKLFFSVVILLRVFTMEAQDSAKVLSRASVIKVPDSNLAKINELVRQFTTRIDKADGLFDRLIIIGPRLWNKMKDLPEFSGILEGNVTFKVPMLEQDGSWTKKEDRTGKVLQTAKEFKNFCTYLENNFKLSGSTQVPMSLRDKFIYWEYFAKIEEGAQAIQSGNNRLMLQFSREKLFFIELTSD